MGKTAQVGNLYFTVEDNWNGQSVDKHTRRRHPNHESSVDEGEVLRLAIEGIKLLQQQSAGTIRSANDALLSKAYAEVSKKDRSVFVNVRKGIHQIADKVHLTARIVGVATLHIWLSQGKTLYLPDPGAAVGDAPYIYKPIGISATAPTDDNPGGTMVPACVVVGVRRRNSISLEAMEATKLEADLDTARRNQAFAALLAYQESTL